jgi:hypothetical protein
MHVVGGHVVGLDPDVIVAGVGAEGLELADAGDGLESINIDRLRPAAKDRRAAVGAMTERAGLDEVIAFGELGQVKIL